MMAAPARPGFPIPATLAAPLAARNMRPVDVNALPASAPTLIQQDGSRCGGSQ
jgi:hypothetical protein